MPNDLLTRRHSIAPATYDAEARTFDATITAGAPVTRADAKGQFLEVLDTSGVDPASLVGIPVLDGHRNGSSADVVGVVEAAWREGTGSIAATIRLSKEAGAIATKVEEGVLRTVSIGYAAAQRSEAFDPPTGRRTVTIRPRILEISIVAIPADPAALIRKVDSQVPEPVNNNQPPAESDNTVVETRAEIRAIARTAGLSAEWADQQIDSGADVTTVRSAAFEAMTARTAPRVRTQGAANDDPSVILERRTAALFARVNGSAPEDEARQYFNDGLIDHARSFLAQSGVSTNGMDKETIVRSAMHTTSDFTQLLTGVGNRTLMPAYQAAESPLKRIARQALHNDFRPASRLKLGETGSLQKIGESGEIKSTTRGEASESYALDTYGSIFSLSRKAIINDDLGAFRDWGEEAGRAAAETEAELLLDALLQSNGAGPVMGEDGKRMFHADHNNIGTPGLISETTLSEARLKMRQQKSLGGKRPIRVAPKILLVGPELETTSEKVLSAIQATQTADANVFAGKLTLEVEPRITDDSWYLFADPAVLAALEYAYLSSAQGPQMASREGFDVLGVEFRVVLDFGVGPVDYRGAFRNAGE